MARWLYIFSSLSRWVAACLKAPLGRGGLWSVDSYSLFFIYSVGFSTVVENSVYMWYGYPIGSPCKGFGRLFGL